MSYIFKMRFFDAKRVFVSVIDQGKPMAGSGENEPILYADFLTLKFYQKALSKMDRNYSRKVINPITVEAENPEELKNLLKWIGNNEAYRILTRIR